MGDLSITSGSSSVTLSSLPEEEKMRGIRVIDQQSTKITKLAGRRGKKLGLYAGSRDGISPCVLISLLEMKDFCWELAPPCAGTSSSFIQ
ncbi:hypothetical protein ACE6H2_022964 [Prunus campanulata]